MVIRPAATLIMLGIMTVLLSCTATGPAGTEAEQGRILYSQSCVSCHGDAATGNGAVAGASNHGSRGHTWHHSDQNIVDIVLGRLDYPNRKMPSFGGQLTEQQVMAIIAYLKTNWTPEQRAAQEAVTQNSRAGR